MLPQVVADRELNLPGKSDTKVQIAARPFENGCVKAHSGWHQAHGKLPKANAGEPEAKLGVLWHDFDQSPTRRPEQWGRLQWPVRLHLCGGGATTAAETARWRRVGTRVDWSCNRRCLRSNLCTLGLPLRGSGQRCLLLLQFRLLHLQSASVVNRKKVHPNVSELTCECARAARVTCSRRLQATQWTCSGAPQCSAVCPMLRTAGPGCGGGPHRG
jgi:hypothetical protein